MGDTDDLHVVDALAASGKTGLPLADRGATWDAGAADKRVRAWAGADKEPNAKYAQAFFFKDGDGSNFGDYKLGFADVVDGKLTAIPKGIFAVAGALGGARTPLKGVSDSDIASIKGKVAGYYSAMAKKFGDKKITPPWKASAENTQTLDTCPECDDTTTWETLTASAEADAFACEQCGRLTEPETEPVVADAADPAATPDLGDDTWHAIFICEGVRTTDGREFSPGSMAVRPLPLPLEAEEHGGPLAASIVSMQRDPALAQALADAGFISLADGAVLLVASGTYTQNDVGQELRRQVNAQEVRFVSAQYEILEGEYVYDPQTDTEFRRVTKGNIMGGAAVKFPAFPQCVICPSSMSLFDAATQGMQGDPTPISTDPTPVAIAAGGGPAIPAAAWFENPRFGANDREDTRLIEDPDHPGRYYCPLTIAPDGRVFGHAAAWHRDHIGATGRTLKPPHSRSNYAHFCTGTVVVDRDGEEDVIRCGVLTMDTGHAPTSGPMASAAAAKRHYDDTGAQVAQIEMGEDAHGIWFAGALIANVPDEKVRALRSGGVSGDWRPQKSGSEMCALLAVNVPGFPMPRPQRSYRVEDGEEMDLALVAAGFIPPLDPVAELVHREISAALDPIRRQLDTLLLERLDHSLDE